MRLEEMAPMLVEYWILEKNDPTSVDMVWYLPGDEITTWYDFTNWVFWIFEVFWIDFRKFLSVLLHGGIHGRYIRSLIYYCILLLHITSMESSWNFYEANVLCMQYRKGSRAGRSWVAGTLKFGACRWWGYEPHWSFLPRDAFIVSLT